MRSAFFLLCALAAAAPAQARPQPLGIFFGWGAFSETSPRRCYAIAIPEVPGRGHEQRPSASVGFWPDRGGMAQLHMRLSHSKRPGSAVILRIDGRSFQLLSGVNDAWAPGPRADGAIIAAMRTGVIMSVESRAEGGHFFRDRYQLRGAATAIDAAAIACARGATGKKPQ
jgi:hypothetical protein